MSIIRLLPKTPKGRIAYAPTARYLTGFAFVLPKIWVKPAGFHSDLWQSPKPGGFRAMLCGKVQNPPGFTQIFGKTNAKPVRYQAVGAYCIRPLGVFGRERMIDNENGRFFLVFIFFFSSLDGRKEAKEDQGLTEAGELGRVQVGVEKRAGKMAGYGWGWKMGYFFLRSAGR